jgi:hypothetical protein
MTKMTTQTKQCTCKYKKRNAPHEYTCELNLNQAEKTKQAHTPTPWMETEDNDNYDITGKDGEWVASLNTALPKEKWEANAQFIVKAVNAHKELVKALKLIERCSYSSDIRSIKELATQARKKAEE